MIGVRHLLVVGVVTAVTGAHPVGVASAAGGPLAAAPSALCHVSDGTFTTCPGGGVEWSDVTPAAFAATGAFLYSDQADLVPDVGIPGSPVDTLMLMYDECATTTPLGPDDYFLVSFDNVEGSGATGDPERIERYSVHVFGDGTLILLVDGKAQPQQNGQIRATEIDGQRGRAGFGPSPNCAVRHLTVEYQIPLAAAAGAGIAAVDGGTVDSGAVPGATGGEDGYSPDPLFWSSTPPQGGNPRTGDRDGDGVRDDLDNCPDTPNANQADTNLDGIGDACEAPERQHATAAFVQAAPDGGTAVDSTDTAVGKEPDLTDRLTRIVQFRTDSGRASSAPDLVDNLVDSLVTLGLVAQSDAAALENAVLAGVDKAFDCTRAVVWAGGAVAGARPTGRGHRDRCHRSGLR